MTTAKILQDLEEKAFDELIKDQDCVKRFVKEMLVKHPEETVCNTITNAPLFQLMRHIIQTSKKTDEPLITLAGSEYFIDYEFYQGDLL